MMTPLETFLGEWRTFLPSDCRAGAFVFAFGRGDNGINACGQAARVVAGFEPRLDFVFGDLLASGVGQRAFKAVTDFDEHLAVLNEDEKNSAIVFIFLSDAPGSENAVCVIRDVRVGFHFRIDRHDDLVTGRFFEIFKFRVELICDRRRRDAGVIVEIAGWRLGNNLGTPCQQRPKAAANRAPGVSRESRLCRERDYC